MNRRRSTRRGFRALLLASALPFLWNGVSLAKGKDHVVKIANRTRSGFDKEDIRAIKKCYSSVKCLQARQREYLDKRDRSFKNFVRQLVVWVRNFVFGGYKVSFRVGGKWCSQFKRDDYMRGCMAMALGRVFDMGAAGKVKTYDEKLRKSTNIAAARQYLINVDYYTRAWGAAGAACEENTFKNNPDCRIARKLPNPRGVPFNPDPYRPAAEVAGADANAAAGRDAMRRGANLNPIGFGKSKGGWIERCPYFVKANNVVPSTGSYAPSSYKVDAQMKSYSHLSKEEQEYKRTELQYVRVRRQFYLDLANFFVRRSLATMAKNYQLQRAAGTKDGKRVRAGWVTKLEASLKSATENCRGIHKYALEETLDALKDKKLSGNKLIVNENRRNAFAIQQLKLLHRLYEARRRKAKYEAKWGLKPKCWNQFDHRCDKLKEVKGEIEGILSENPHFHSLSRGRTYYRRLISKKELYQLSGLAPAPRAPEPSYASDLARLSANWQTAAGFWKRPRRRKAPSQVVRVHNVPIRIRAKLQEYMLDYFHSALPDITNKQVEFMRSACEVPEAFSKEKKLLHNDGFMKAFVQTQPDATWAYCREYSIAKVEYKKKKSLKALRNFVLQMVGMIPLVGTALGYATEKLILQPEQEAELKSQIFSCYVGLGPCNVVSDAWARLSVVRAGDLIDCKTTSSGTKCSFSTSSAIFRALDLLGAVGDVFSAVKAVKGMVNAMRRGKQAARLAKFAQGDVAKVRRLANDLGLGDLAKNPKELARASRDPHLLLHHIRDAGPGRIKRAYSSRKATGIDSVPVNHDFFKEAYYVAGAAAEVKRAKPTKLMKIAERLNEQLPEKHRLKLTKAAHELREDIMRVVMKAQKGKLDSPVQLDVVRIFGDPPSPKQWRAITRRVWGAGVNAYKRLRYGESGVSIAAVARKARERVREAWQGATKGFVDLWRSAKVRWSKWRVASAKRTAANKKGKVLILAAERNKAKRAAKPKLAEVENSLRHKRSLQEQPGVSSLAGVARPLRGRAQIAKAAQNRAATELAAAEKAQEVARDQASAARLIEGLAPGPLKAQAAKASAEAAEKVDKAQSALAQARLARYDADRALGVAEEGLRLLKQSPREAVKKQLLERAKRAIREKKALAAKAKAELTKAEKRLLAAKRASEKARLKLQKRKAQLRAAKSQGELDLMRADNRRRRAERARQKELREIEALRQRREAARARGPLRQRLAAAVGRLRKRVADGIARAGEQIREWKNRRTARKNLKKAVRKAQKNIRSELEEQLRWEAAIRDSRIAEAGADLGQTQTQLGKKLRRKLGRADDRLLKAQDRTERSLASAKQRKKDTIREAGASAKAQRRTEEQAAKGELQDTRTHVAEEKQAAKTTAGERLADAEAGAQGMIDRAKQGAAHRETSARAGAERAQEQLGAERRRDVATAAGRQREAIERSQADLTAARRSADDIEEGARLRAEQRTDEAWDKLDQAGANRNAALRESAQARSQRVADANRNLTERVVDADQVRRQSVTDAQGAIRDAFVESERKLNDRLRRERATRTREIETAARRRDLALDAANRQRSSIGETAYRSKVEEAQARYRTDVAKAHDRYRARAQDARTRSIAEVGAATRRATREALSTRRRAGGQIKEAAGRHTRSLRQADRDFATRHQTIQKRYELEADIAKRRITEAGNTGARERAAAKRQADGIRTRAQDAHDRRVAAVESRPGSVGHVEKVFERRLDKARKRGDEQIEAAQRSGERQVETAKRRAGEIIAGSRQDQQRAVVRAERTDHRRTTAAKSTEERKTRAADLRAQSTVEGARGRARSQFRTERREIKADFRAAERKHQAKSDRIRDQHWNETQRALSKHDAEVAAAHRSFEERTAALRNAAEQRSAAAGAILRKPKKVPTGSMRTVEDVAEQLSKAGTRADLAAKQIKAHMQTVAVPQPKAPEGKPGSAFPIRQMKRIRYVAMVTRDTTVRDKHGKAVYMATRGSRVFVSAESAGRPGAEVLSLARRLSGRWRPLGPQGGRPRSTSGWILRSALHTAGR